MKYNYLSFLLVVAGCSSFNPNVNRDIAAVKNLPIMGEYSLMKSTVGKCSARISIQQIENGFLISKIASEGATPVIESVPISKVSSRDFTIESSYKDNVLDVKTTRVKRAIVELSSKKETIREIYKNSDGVLSYKLSDGAKKNEVVMSECEFGPVQAGNGTAVGTQTHTEDPVFDFDASEQYLTSNEWSITGNLASFMLVDKAEQVVKDPVSDKALQSLQSCGFNVSGTLCLGAQRSFSNVMVKKLEKGYRHLFASPDKLVFVSKVYSKDNKFIIAGVKVYRLPEEGDFFTAYQQNKLELLIDIGSSITPTQQNLPKLLDETTDMKLLYHLISNAQSLGLNNRKLIEDALIKNLSAIVALKDSNYVLAYLKESRSRGMKDFGQRLAQENFSSSVDQIKHLSAIILAESGQKTPEIKAALISAFTTSTDWSIRRDALTQFGNFIETPADRSLVLARITDSDSDVSQVAYNLASSQSLGEGDINSISSLLSNSNYAYRVRAINLLAKIDSDSVIPLIIAKLSDSDNDVRNAASKTLKAKQIGPQHLEALKAQLGSSSYSTRLEALYFISLIKNLEADKLIIGRILDTDSDVTRAAQNYVSALRLSNDHIEAIRQVGNSSNWSNRRTAVQLFDRIGTVEAQVEQVKFLSDTDQDVRNSVMSSLMSKAPVVPVLKAVLSTINSVQTQVTDVMATWLAKNPVAEAEPIMTRLCSHQSWSTRNNCAKNLNSFSSTAMGALLISKFNDTDQDVRNSAFAAVAARKLSVDDIPALAAVKGGNAEGEKQAVIQLTRLGVAAFESLLLFKSDNDWSVRLQTVKALQSLNTDAALNVLIPMCIDTDSDVVNAAKSAVTSGSLNEIHVAALSSLLNNQNWSVRQFAANQLGRIKSQKSIDALLARLGVETDNDVKNAIANALRTAQ